MKHKKYLPVVIIFLSLVGFFIFQEALGDNIRYALYNHEKNKIGFLFYGLFHANWKHLTSNLGFFLTFGFILQKYFYHKDNVKLIILFYFATSFLHYLIHVQDSAYYIGASGWIYALVTYTLIRGLLSEDSIISTVSVLILSSISVGFVSGATPASYSAWDCHLAGAIVGMLMNFIKLPFLFKESKAKIENINS